MMQRKNHTFGDSPSPNSQFLAILMERYRGWLNDYLGLDDVDLLQELLEQFDAYEGEPLANLPVLSWSSRSGQAIWNPLEQPYRVFREIHPAAQPYIPSQHVDRTTLCDGLLQQSVRGS